jgi:RNA polymerase sigma factor (sigma-70 family)
MKPVTVTADAGDGAATRPPDQFATTHWTVVLQAGGAQTSEGRQALEQVCRTYWYPLYAFARRCGEPPEEAQDLTQAFFLHLLTHELIGRADRHAGRFRSLLLAAFRNFMANEQVRAAALKRGGGSQTFAIDSTLGECWLGREPAIGSTPEALFDRAWAMRVLEQALERLASEYNSPNRREVFEQLCPLLEGEKAEGGYATVARRLSTTENTIKWAVSRMRARYRELIRSVIARTVTTPEDLEEEFQHLIAALRS